MSLSKKAKTDHIALDSMSKTLLLFYIYEANLNFINHLMRLKFRS